MQKLISLADQKQRLHNLVVEQIEILFEKGMLLFHCRTNLLA